MTRWQLKTPVALVIFNRPDKTRKVFETIRQVKPPKLFVIADGQRENRPGEADKCAAARAIAEGIDWECELFRNYSDINMGAGKRVSSGISWVFDQVDEAIILEDDCLPDSTFFRFCSDLLERYRNDKRIMMISGTNSLEEWRSDSQSYHFSFYGSPWGWATWKRAWRYYDNEMTSWQQASWGKIARLLSAKDEIEHLQRTFHGVAGRTADIWDCQWTFCRLLHAGLSAVPSVNLVSNIGFGRDATHTTASLSMDALLYRSSMNFPLKETTVIEADREFDRKCFLRQIGRPDIEVVLAQVTKLLNADRNIYALLLIEGALSGTLTLTTSDLSALRQLRTLAITKLSGANKPGETFQ